MLEAAWAVFNKVGLVHIWLNVPSGIDSSNHGTSSDEVQALGKTALWFSWNSCKDESKDQVHESSNFSSLF